MQTPTREQQDIIDHDDSLVVTACPGSGKTFTVATKVRRILKELKPFRGVVAISFTNKASRELKARCVSDGGDPKASFFGTIDSFCLSEVLFPFLPHLFGLPNEDLQVADQDRVRVLAASVSDWDDLTLLERAKVLWSQNALELLAVAPLTLHVLSASAASRRYLTARYRWIFIDEYQDCDEHQHAIFLRLVELGLKGAAVGDPDQSIFGFAGKSPKHLMQLAANGGRFQSFSITRNHRSHPSIVHYAARLLSPTHAVPDALPPRVLRVRPNGDESHVASWIGASLAGTMRHFGVLEHSSVAVLFRSRRTRDIVESNIGIPYKSIAETPLDRSSTAWGLLFRRLLYWAHDADETKLELIEQYASRALRKADWGQAKRWLAVLATAAPLGTLAATEPTFVSLARMFFPHDQSVGAVSALRSVFAQPAFLWSYAPPRPDQVQLMTLHKSKGLEFELVFHLDLYRFIMPMYNGDYAQDLNLHYVGVTRAKTAVILCTSSRRTQHSGQTKAAEISEFFAKNGVNKLSTPFSSIVP